MLTPGLAKLLEPLSVVCAATHSVKILRNKGMVVVRQGKPIHVDRPFVAGIGSQREPDAAIYCTTVNCCKPISSPMMTSGPGTVPTPGWFSAGSLADLTSPFSSSCMISMGCMVAPMEILPATARHLTGGQGTRRIPSKPPAGRR